MKHSTIQKLCQPNCFISLYHNFIINIIEYGYRIIHFFLYIQKS